VLITTRSKKGPNTFSQQIKNLEPGRLYSFRMFSGDVDDLSQVEPHAITIKFENATPVPEKSFSEVCKSRMQASTFVNWHIRVFRAKGPTARLSITDWADDQPGGEIGQRLMFNFIKVQPYRDE